MLILALAYAGAPASAPPADVYFAEPVTGRKVASYSVDLPVSRTETQTLTIPDQCERVPRMVELGDAFRGSIVGRRTWQKVESDCRYHAFLHRHPMRGVEDYVSGYDFMNARIEDLPVDNDCASGAFDLCDPTATDDFGMLRYFPVAEPARGSDADEQTTGCRLEGGLFRGRLLVGNGGIRCEPDPTAPSLRLIGIDFADINGDRYVDALLRFVPIGRGAIRSPMILPVTRTRADGPFEVPEPLPPPFSRHGD